MHFHRIPIETAQECGKVKGRRVAPGTNEQSCYTMDAMLPDLEDSEDKERLSGFFPSKP